MSGYAIDAARLPGPLSLVLCEASNAHPGSARRLLPCISEKLHDSAVALVRNVRRRSDFDYLADWSRDNQASFVVKGKADPFAKIAMRNKAPAESHQAARINTAFAEKKNGVKSQRLATPAPVVSDARFLHANTYSTTTVRCSGTRSNPARLRSGRRIWACESTTISVSCRIYRNPATR